MRVTRRSQVKPVSMVNVKLTVRRAREGKACFLPCSHIRKDNRDQNTTHLGWNLCYVNFPRGLFSMRTGSVIPDHLLYSFLTLIVRYRSMRIRWHELQVSQVSRSLFLGQGLSWVIFRPTCFADNVISHTLLKCSFQAMLKTSRLRSSKTDLSFLQIYFS